MNDLNTVAVVGRLTRDVEMRQTNSGMAIASISIAVNRRVKDQSGNWEDKMI